MPLSGDAGMGPSYDRGWLWCRASDRCPWSWPWDQTWVAAEQAWAGEAGTTSALSGRRAFSSSPGHWSPWQLATPFSVSFVGSETRFWSVVQLSTGREQFRFYVSSLSSGWNGTPFPAPESGIECKSVVLDASGTRWDLKKGINIVGYSLFKFFFQWRKICCIL